jgi:hypothetical protein
MMFKTVYMRTSFLILSVAGIALLAIFVVGKSHSKGRASQPIEFDHKVHIDNAGLRCTDCHVHAGDNPVATIPSLEVCQNCHSADPVSKSPEELKVLAYVAERKEIPWQQIYRVPEHVYFSHRRHVTVGKLECSACHGNMNEQTMPVTAPFLAVTMENCTNCHKEHKITNDCLACHR